PTPRRARPSPPASPSRSPASPPRRPPPLREPLAVALHARALRLRRTTPARARLLAARRRAPAHLDAVVGVVRHLERTRAREHVGERQRPLRSVAAHVGEAPS